VERKRFEVRSAWNAEIFRCDRPWAAISISTRGDFPVLSEENRRGLLQLVFADTADPDRPDSFAPAIATEILDFVQQMWFTSPSKQNYRVPLSSLQGRSQDPIYLQPSRRGVD